MRHGIRTALLLALLATAARAASYPPTRARSYMVSCGHPEASRAGAEVLAGGGDAADAAVAVMASLGVVTPDSSGLGGGVFLVVYRAAEKRTYVIDAREIAPRRATRDMYLRDGEAVPELSRVGGLAVAVPGEVRGMQAVHDRWGKLPWAAAFAPAIRQARRGVGASTTIRYLRGRMEERIRRFPETTRVFLPGGRVPELDHPLRNPDLAGTLEGLASNGPSWFYEGELAREIVAVAQAEGGILDARDLADYEVTWREPVRGSFRGHEIVSMPPPSSGGAVLIEILQALEHFPLEKMGWNSSGHLHHVAEVMKVAFADRALHMGDPAFVDVPLARFVSKDYAAKVAATVSPYRVRPHEDYALEVPEDGGTSHFSIVDAAGNVIAGTSTINFALGSLVTVPGRGFVLNNEMDDFAIAPGVPNAFGLVGREANAVAPGKKPLSSMSPTLVFEDGRPVLALGGSGGPRIITGTLQVILNSLVFGKDVQEAVDAPRIHHQWKPDELRVEEGIPRDVVRALEARGHQVREMKFVGGKINALGFLPDRIEGAGDPRKGGRPAGR